ncbi:T9SS type A sorting domain-containing protein [Psychroflexus sp. YR1-1]|uniref:T9SS type A sorting domain-containing protein n=1 Tax=Psychroflexus aurantiacus TaxID=2709310 RepID=A0A6B3R1U4_9FLAO|nr:T9SS type A sorting domain-containing protein [Psychroflexus aurantiacus]NEV92595.1 T9SS type A sorting domain-containing protein [Psychroflexus aurantiacus]
MKKISALLIFTLVSNVLWSQVFIAENPNMRVTLKNDVDLSVAGDITNNDSIYGTGFLELIQAQSQFVSGNGIIEKFRVNKTGGQAEITGGHQDVFRLFEIHGGTFIPNARLTLKSVDSLTAQIGQNTGGSITGDFVIERFIPRSNRAFRYMSSPVSTSGTVKANLQEGVNNTGYSFPEDNKNPNPGYGTHITGSSAGNNGFDATQTGNPGMYFWNATSQSYTIIPNTDNTQLSKGQSFPLFIRGSRATNLNQSNLKVGPETTLRLTGNPSILNFSKSISLEIDNSYLLLGNPYHGAIDANSFFADQSNLSPNFIYVYDPTLNEFGGNVTVELPEGINAQGSDANQFIQAWQSVFVKASNTGTTTLDLTFSETHKTISESQLVIFKTNTGSRINLRLLADNNQIDGVSIKFIHGANSEIDDRDADKLPNTGESLSIYSNNTNLSIEERDYPQSIDTTLIRLVNKNRNQYQFKIDGTNFSEINAIFKDFYLDEEYPLEDNKELVVDYQVAEGEPDMRFGFIYNSESLSSEEFASRTFKVYPNPAQDVLNIETVSTSSQKLEFEIYSLLGQKVARGSFEDKLSNYDISSLSTGVYLIVISDDNNLKETLKLIKT